MEAFIYATTAFAVGLPIAAHVGNLHSICYWYVWGRTLQVRAFGMHISIKRAK